MARVHASSADQRARERHRALRLTPEKVKQLADLVARHLEENPEVNVQIKPDALRSTISTLINDDLKEEAEIEAEARKTLEAHREQIRRSGANFDDMLHKSIKKLARDRGFTL
jgi:hypothetical protein